jgi:hypothetical protein
MHWIIQHNYLLQKVMGHSNIIVSMTYLRGLEIAEDDMSVIELGL